MILPDCWDFMIGITARHVLKVPPTLTAKHRSQASSVSSSTNPSTKMPALLTNTSIRPKPSRTCSTTRATAELFVTSQASPRAVAGS